MISNSRILELLCRLTGGFKDGFSFFYKLSTMVVPYLTVDGQTVRGHKEIASSMNEYVCSIGKKLSEKIPRKANPLLSGEYAIEAPPLSFSFSAIMTDKSPQP